MSIRPDHPIATAVARAQEWQRLSWSATSQGMGHYLHGCAHIAMTRTPKQALAELHKMQTVLLRHLVATCAEATKFWREQTAELLVIQTKRRHAPRRPRTTP